MKFSVRLLAPLALAAVAGVARAQFTDTFNTINPAWVTNRFSPAGFDAVVFDGDNRLRLTLDQTGSPANRSASFSSEFYNTQGRERPGGITGLWTLSTQLYFSSAFNTTTGLITSSDFWAHTGTTPGGGDYATFGFTNESPTDYLNPAAADRAFSLLVYTANTGYVHLAAPVGFQFDAWHVLSTTSTGAAFEFRIDGVLLLTAPTAAGNDLLSAMVQGYNYGGTGNYSTAFYWDNLVATAIPEPGTSALLAAVGVLGLAVWRRRRAVR